MYVGIMSPLCQAIDCLVRGLGVPTTTYMCLWFFCYSSARFYYTHLSGLKSLCLFSFNETSVGLGNVISALILSGSHAFLRLFDTFFFFLLSPLSSFHLGCTLPVILSLSTVSPLQILCSLFNSLSWNWRWLLIILNNLISSFHCLSLTSYTMKF